MNRLRGIVIVCMMTPLTASCSNVLFAGQMQIVFAPFLSGNDVPEMNIANADGSNVRSVLPPARELRVLSLAVDPRDGMIYYGRSAASYEISRVRPDGTGRTTLYSLRTLDPLVFNRSNATPSPYGISIDTVHNKLYWVGGQNNSNGFGLDIPTFIQRSNLDGSNVEIIRQSLWTESSPYSLAVDGASEKMYWTDMSDFSIRSANLDGSGMQTVLHRGNVSAQSGYELGGLAIDFQHQLMFWSEHTPDRNSTNIMSAGLDGTGMHTILTVPHGLYGWFDIPSVVGLAVDPATSQLYFQNFVPGTVYKANYDGSDLEILISGINGGLSLGLLPVPEPNSVELGLLAFVALVLATRISRAGNSPACQRLHNSHKSETPNAIKRPFNPCVYVHSVRMDRPLERLLKQ